MVRNVRSLKGVPTPTAAALMAASYPRGFRTDNRSSLYAGRLLPPSKNFHCVCLLCVNYSCSLEQPLHDQTSFNLALHFGFLAI